MNDTMPFGDEMSQDDLQALTALGLFAFGESKVLEKTTVDNPLVNTHIEDGSFKIRKALVDAERQVKMKAHVPQGNVPSFSYPEMPPIPAPIPMEMLYPVQQVQLPSPVISQTVGDVQLEFSFDPKKQDITNDLLREISSKLSKIITYLDTQKENIVKLKA